MHLHRFKPGLCISTTSDSKRNKHTLTHTATHNGAKQVHCLTSLSKPYLLRFATPVTASACAILRQNRCTVCQAVQTLPAAVRNTGNCKCLRQTAPKQVHCLSSRPNLTCCGRNTGNCKCLRQTAPKQVHCLSSRPNLTCCGRITGNCKCLRHARVAPENRHRARSKQGLFSIFCLRPHPFFHELHAVEVAAHRATHGECSVRMGSHVLWGFLQGIFVCIYMYVFTIVFCSVCACVCVCVLVCVCL